MPEGKTLIRRDPYLFLTGRFGFRAEPAELMQPAGVMQGIFETERMIDLPRQRERLAAELQSTVGIAEVPQGERQITTVSDAGIFANQRGPVGGSRAVIVFRDRAVAPLVSAEEIAAIEHRQPAQEKRFHQNAGIVEPLAKFHRLLGQIGTEPKVAAHHMKGDSCPTSSRSAAAFLRAVRKERGRDRIPGRLQDRHNRAMRSSRFPSSPSSSSSRVSRSGEGSSLSSNASPFVKWEIASTLANLSRDRIAALSL